MAAFPGCTCDVNRRIPTLGVIDESVKKRTPYAFIAPGVFNEKLNEIHRLTPVFGSPLVAAVCKPANASIAFGNENHSEFRRLENPLVDALSFARRCSRIPFVQEFFDEFAQTRNIRGADRTNLYCGSV